MGRWPGQPCPYVALCRTTSTPELLAGNGKAVQVEEDELVSDFP